MAMTTEMHLRETEESHYRFNYKGMHRYLITLPSFRLQSIFTGPEIVLKVLDLLRDTTWKFHFDVYAYCFLPDRLVTIIRGKTEYSDMKAFLSAFRASSAATLEPGLGHPLWRRTYLERVLRKQEDSERIAAEVYRLPEKEGLVAPGVDYPFKGSFVKDLEPKSRPPRTSFRKERRAGAKGKPSQWKRPHRG